MRSRKRCKASSLDATFAATWTPGEASSQRVSWRDRVELSLSMTTMGKSREMPAENTSHSMPHSTTGIQLSMPKSQKSPRKRRHSRASAETGSLSASFI
ncbi:hypothetical protein D3C72_1761080 [compost metagenome]